MTDEQNKADIAAALASGDPLALLKIKSRMDDEQIAELKAELVRRSPSSPSATYSFMDLDDAKRRELVVEARSPSVPTATQEQRDAERWRFVRPALGVDGDYTDGSGDSPCLHVQWLTVDDEKLHRLACHEGWTHTVESLIDASLSAARVQGENSQ